MQVVSMNLLHATCKQIHNIMLTCTRNEHTRIRRFVVMLDGRSKGVRIKPENLMPVNEHTGSVKPNLPNKAFSGKVVEK